MNRFITILTLFVASLAQAGIEDFRKGPVIQDFGEHFTIPSLPVPENTVFKITFDVAAAAKPGEVNRKFNSLARFINMHAAAGVDPDNIHLALVVHGKASMELLDHASFNKAFGTDNENKLLLQVLMNNNVQIMLCGQSAGAYDIEPELLIDGVQIALSAMTAHAMLQQQGYTVNPF